MDFCEMQMKKNKKALSLQCFKKFLHQESYLIMVMVPLKFFASIQPVFSP